MLSAIRLLANPVLIGAAAASLLWLQHGWLTDARDALQAAEDAAKSAERLLVVEREEGARLADRLAAVASARGECLAVELPGELWD